MARYQHQDAGEMCPFDVIHPQSFLAIRLISGKFEISFFLYGNIILSDDMHYNHRDACAHAYTSRALLLSHYDEVKTGCDACHRKVLSVAALLQGKTEIQIPQK